MENTNCQHKLEILCNICGLYTPKTRGPLAKSKQRAITDLVKASYFSKYKRTMVCDSTYAPNIVCFPCYSNITSRSRSQANLPESPMVWNPPNAEHTNCYACLTASLFGKKFNDRRKITYPEYPITNSIPAIWASVQEQERDRSPQPGTHMQQVSSPAHRLSTSTSQQQSPRPSTSTFMQPVYSPVHGPSTSTSQERSPKPSPLIATTSGESKSSGTLIDASSQSSGEFYQPTNYYTNQERQPILMSQEEFNDHCRDLDLNVTKSELEGSRLAERNFLQDGVRITSYRTDTRFSFKFQNENINLTIRKQKSNEDSEEDGSNEEITVTYNLAFANDLQGLFQLFGIEHKPDEWRLFLDGSSKSFKAVLLHNKNLLPSVPLAYCKRLPEKYENIEYILNRIKYQQYGWEVIVDFKLINIITGLMGAASKHPCAHCLWDSKYKGSDKYTKTDWPKRPQWSTETAGKYNAVKPPLIPISKILMPPLHIKIGLVTQLFKKLYERNSKIRATLFSIFPSLSEAKIKAGVYDGPQIEELFQDNDLPKILTVEENYAFDSLKSVCKGFLGNKRDINHTDLIRKMMESFEKLGINITIKMHSLICHLDIFKESCGAYSDEQGERFHQDLKKNEADYAGKNMARGLARYCWKLIRETDPDTHRRQASYGKKINFFFVNQH